MKNKRCLGFLVITLILVISMFSNVFASTGSGWTCISEYNTQYSVGETINYLNSIDLTATNDRTASAIFESNFEVKSGDRLFLEFSSVFSGDSEYFDEAVSACWATIVAENGDTLLDINYTLDGNKTGHWTSQSTTVTDDTAGKLTFYIGLEGTGTKKVDSTIGDIYFVLNDNDK